MKPYSEDFKCVAVKLLNDTKRPLKDIANELGVHRITLKHWYQKSEGKNRDSKGYPRGRHPGQKVLTKEQIDKIKSLADSGLSKSIICHRFKISKSTYHRYVVKGNTSNLECTDLALQIRVYLNKKVSFKVEQSGNIAVVITDDCTIAFKDNARLTFK